MHEHLPGKHRLRVPIQIGVVYGSRRFFSVFAALMAAVCLYGPILGRAPDHNAYRYLVGPFVCPLIGLVLHLLFPFNPYRWNGPANRSLNYLDERDERARLLVEILRTPGYRAAVLNAAALLTISLIAIMGTCAVLFRDSLVWSPVSSGFFFGWVGGLLFAWMFIRVRLISWALDTWWSQYGGRQ